MFARLSAAVLDVTDGKVRFELDDEVRLGTRELAAVRGGDRTPLAFVGQSEGGYPVSVQPATAKTSYVARSREELEAALAELLKDVRVAERIKSLAAEPSEEG